MLVTARIKVKIKAIQIPKSENMQYRDAFGAPKITGLIII